MSTDPSRLSRGRTRDGAIFPVALPAASLPESYAATLQEIKNLLRSARVRAVLAANPIVIGAYWHTGQIILARQQEAAWGAKVIDRLAADLKVLLWSLQQRHGRPGFGVCGSCHFFQRNAAGEEAGGPHRCGVTREPLSDADARHICIEHAPLAA